MCRDGDTEQTRTQTQTLYIHSSSNSQLKVLEELQDLYSLDCDASNLVYHFRGHNHCNPHRKVPIHILSLLEKIAKIYVTYCHTLSAGWG